MQKQAHLLTPENLSMLSVIDRTGSLAAAARALNLVPSALTYRLRQLEDGLDALLVQRSSKRSALTPAGLELLRTGEPVLEELDAIARRVKRIATGWEPELVIIADALIDQRVLLELCQTFLALQSPTQLRLEKGTMNGTLESLVTGRADLALGVSSDNAQFAGIQTTPLGQVPFVFAVAPFHPLAVQAASGRVITDGDRAHHLAVAAADSSARRSSNVLGVVAGQPVLTVHDMQSKLEMQLAGVACGFLPLPIARDHLLHGRLVEIPLRQHQRNAKLSAAWREGAATAGQALKWWLKQLQSTKTRRALVGHE